jgi:hypothetical protein
VVASLHVTDPTQWAIAVQSGQVSGAPSSRYRPAAQMSHCDVVALAHVGCGGETHPVTGEQSEHTLGRAIPVDR